MFYDVNWNIFASNSSEQVVLKVSKCHPLDTKLASESVVEVAYYWQPLILIIACTGITFTENMS